MICVGDATTREIVALAGLVPRSFYTPRSRARSAFLYTPQSLRFRGDRSAQFRWPANTRPSWSHLRIHTYLLSGGIYSNSYGAKRNTLYEV